MAASARRWPRCRVRPGARWIAGLLVVAAAVAVLAWTARARPQPVPAAGTHAGTGGDSAAGTPLDAAAALPAGRPREAPASRTALDPEVAARARVAVAVRVRDAAGTPVAGARVELFEVHASKPAEETTAGQEGCTDAEGRVRFATDAIAFEVVATAPDGGRDAWREPPIAASEVEVELVPRQPCRLTATVRDADDRPVPGQTVLVDPPHTQKDLVPRLKPQVTDQYGRCEWELFCEGRYTVHVDDDDIPAKRVVMARDGERHDVVLHRRGRYRCAVTVYDAAGKLVDEGWLRLTLQARQARGWMLDKLTYDERIQAAGATLVAVPIPGSYRVQAYGPEGERNDPLLVEVRETDVVVPVQVVLR